jgi:2-polyprenyl-6-methoxyphenol hydroxylase-like FAD-dependent oxidoreductase
MLDDVFQIFASTTAIPPNTFTKMTVQYEEFLGLDEFSRAFDDSVGAERSITRSTLRQILLTGLEDVVQFDMQVTHYNSNEDGTVTVFFKDGTSATGDLLVGAEGTRSPTRRQYLPHVVVLWLV